MLCGEALSPGVCPALRLFVAFAELPQASKWRNWPLRNFRKHQNGENSVCGTSASIKMEKMAFAELPQASKWRKWPLRDSRKHQNGENGLCGTSASVKMEEMAFAGLPQASKSSPWDLRNSRKHQKVSRETCGTPANTKKFLERLAGLSQAFPKVIFPLVCSIFGHSARIGTKKAGPAMSNRKPCFVYQRKTDAPGERCAVFMSSIPRSQPSAHPPERSRLP